MKSVGERDGVEDKKLSKYFVVYKTRVGYLRIQQLPISGYRELCRIFKREGFQCFTLAETLEKIREFQNSPKKDPITLITGSKVRIHLPDCFPSEVFIPKKVKKE